MTWHGDHVREAFVWRQGSVRETVRMRQTTKEYCANWELDLMMLRRD